MIAHRYFGIVRSSFLAAAGLTPAMRGTQSLRPLPEPGGSVASNALQDRGERSSSWPR
jgi:hypothetical protein